MSATVTPRFAIENTASKPGAAWRPGFAAPPLAADSFDVLIPKFLDYSRYELRSSEATVRKQRDCLTWVRRDLSHVEGPELLSLDDITTLKKEVFARGAGEARANSIIFALRGFLHYCRKVHGLQTVDPKDLAPVRQPKRRVVFLTPEEIKRFLAAIKTHTFSGLRFMALTQVLLATGMRIGEALSLNRSDIDWDNRQAMIIGKGNKERMVFFSAESLQWLQRYLDRRLDRCEAVFVTLGEPRRLKPFDLPKLFKRYRTRAGITKKLTPHILRHTMATLLRNNGCDITFIRDLLGHSDISITAEFYVGTSERLLKDAHDKYLRF
jgi:site-specific recombinase XerD